LKGNFEFRSDAGDGKLTKLPSAIDSCSNSTLGSDAFQNIRILHVDDDAGLLTTTKQILELQNPFYVEIASSVREGLEKLEKLSFDEAVSLFSGTSVIRFVNGCSGLFSMVDSLLRQIFYNLIDDSLKHGEKVSQIKVYSEEESDHLNLIYEDNGIGIPETEKEGSFTEGYSKDNGY